MACVEHECFECGRWFADNERHEHCPKCGGRVSNDFDEDSYHFFFGQPDDWDDRDDRPEDIDPDLRESLLEDGGAEIFD